MLYVKAELGNGIEIRVPLYGDEVITICPVCGVEHKVDEEMLAYMVREGLTEVYCEKCSEGGS